MMSGKIFCKNFVPWLKLCSEIILKMTKLLSLSILPIVYIQFSIIILIIASSIDNQFISALLAPTGALVVMMD